MWSVCSRRRLASQALRIELFRFIARAAVLIVVPETDLRRDILPVAMANLLQRPTEDFLAPAPTVHVRRVEEIDAEFDRAFDRGDGFLVARARPAVGFAVEHDRAAKLPAAEPHLTNPPSCFSKNAVYHRAIELAYLAAIGKVDNVDHKSSRKSRQRKTNPTAKRYKNRVSHCK